MKKDEKNALVYVREKNGKMYLRCEVTTEKGKFDFAIGQSFFNSKFQYLLEKSLPRK